MGILLVMGTVPSLQLAAGGVTGGGASVWGVLVRLCNVRQAPVLYRQGDGA